MKRILPLLAALMAAAPGSAEEFPILLPEEASLVTQIDEDFARVSFPVTPAVRGEVELEQIEGAVRTSVLQFPSTLALDTMMSLLRSQFEARELKIILDCTARRCGGFDFRQTVATQPPPEMVVDLAQFGYLAGRDTNTDAVEYVLLSLAGQTGYLQHVAVVPGSIPQPEIARPIESTQTLTEETSEGDIFAGKGAVVLEGLIFETGSAALSDAEYPGLRALAEFLEANPNASVVLVGHTDAEGGLAPNIALSRQRAEAVRGRLIEGMGVSPDQITSDGVGYLAPRETNTTQEGRLRNRRVEAVLMDR